MMLDYLDEDCGYSQFVSSRVPEHVQRYTEARLLHIALGLCTEAGEFADPIKKAIPKAQSPEELDFVNMDEEIGDILFYIQDYCNFRGTSIPQLAARNEAKLTKRYPNGFNAQASDNRDLDAERKVLEEGQLKEEVVLRAPDE